MLQQSLPLIRNSAQELVALAIALGARDVAGWTDQEELICHDLPVPASWMVTEVRREIEQGLDPLGDAYCRLFTNDERRPKGQTFTPHIIVEAMLRWASEWAKPRRVIDPGAGSARFLVGAGRAFTDAELLAVELDPLAAILARGHIAAAGLAHRSRVLLHDYREAPIPSIEAQTLFIGNPPYVRHHLLGEAWKAWLVEAASRCGLRASQLAGLHVHFFMATVRYARPGDAGVLITAAEWMDVNYGHLVRQLLTGALGVRNIQIVEPEAMPFPGTATTAVITGFEVGARPASVGVRRVSDLADLESLESDYQIRRERLEAADRWTPLTRGMRERREGFVELGELCRVHRGQVTGANQTWITRDNEYGLPESVLFPSVTRARELFAAKDVLDDPSTLRRVIDLPVDLDVLDASERRRVERFIKLAKASGASDGYVARNRRAWWSVGLRDPAPILATYMARRPPVFVRNLADVRHINIAHGLYPREALNESQLRSLARYLSQSTSTEDGRTYAGGLTKFEPREMERLLVPHPDHLSAVDTDFGIA